MPAVAEVNRVQHGEAFATSPSAQSSLDCLSSLHLPATELFPDDTLECGRVEHIFRSDTDPTIDEAITEMAHEVQNGKLSLVGQTYIFDPYSQGAKELFKAVARAQKKNPEFEFLLNVNTLSTPKYNSIIHEASLYGVKMRLACYSNQLGRGSLHSKSWVLDGNTAYVGGDNVDNTPENDYMMSFKGPIVKKVQQDLLDAWKKASSYQKHPELNDREVNQIFQQAVPEKIHSSEMYPIAALSKPGIGWFGKYYQNDADQGILDAIDSATESVQILGPNVNDARVLESLCAAAERGVRVQVLLPKGYQRFPSWIDRATNAAPMIYRSRLSVQGHENFEVRHFSVDHHRLAFSHAKFYGVDGEVVIVGSQNPDNQSFRFSREFNLAVCDPEAAKMIKAELFDEFWESSVPAVEKLWHKIAPIPSRKSWERIARCVIYPFELLENLALYVASRWNTAQ